MKPCIRRKPAETQEPTAMMKCMVPFLLCIASWAQQTDRPNPTVANLDPIAAQKIAAEHEARSNVSPVNMQARFEQQQIANMVSERHAQLQRDTEKLVALTAELKQNVDKAGRNILSMDVIKTAQEIQKLAKSVQEKMKNAY
jgi:hypothetical protein